MTNHIKSQYVNSPSYRQEHTLAYKVTLTVAVIVIWAAVFVGAVLAN